MVLVIDSVQVCLLFLARRGLHRWMWIHLYFRPKSGCVFTGLEDSQEGGKAALEDWSRRCEIASLSFLLSCSETQQHWLPSRAS